MIVGNPTRVHLTAARWMHDKKGGGDGGEGGPSGQDGEESTAPTGEVAVGTGQEDNQGGNDGGESEQTRADSAEDITDRWIGPEDGVGEDAEVTESAPVFESKKAGRGKGTAVKGKGKTKAKPAAKRTTRAAKVKAALLGSVTATASRLAHARIVAS